MAEKAQLGKIYIPRRIYDRLKTIYTSRVTVIAAPDGSGKSTYLSEFILRSRRKGVSCRFVTDSRSVEECFARLCEIVLGEKRQIPLSFEEQQSLKREFEAAKPQKDTIIVLDNPHAAEMLISRVRVAELAAKAIPARLVVTSSALSSLHREICERFGFSLIEEETLLLTREEALEYFVLCGMTPANPEKLYSLSRGNIMRLHMGLCIVDSGYPLPDNGNKLLETFFRFAVSYPEQGAILTALSFLYLSDEYCADLNSSQVLREYYGKYTFQPENVFALVERFYQRTGLVSLNRRTRRVSCNPVLFYFVVKDFFNSPPEVQRDFRLALARHFLRLGNTYYAFVEFSLAGDYESAAACPNTTRVSFGLLLKSKDTLLRFVENCPLECKAIVPSYLRIVALLMLTDYREKMRNKFDKAENFISTSANYTRKERMQLLSYIHNLRTYEDFFKIEDMGTHIKRAYELYDGKHALMAPFYSWNLYTPSVFALIHRYSMPISAESEQFLRYHRMYSDMILHGEHICELYSSEALYYTGDFKQAAVAAQAGLAECTEERNLPTRISFLTLCAKLALFSGDYSRFEELTREMKSILHEESANEIGTMTSLCITELSSYWGEAEENGSFLRYMSDSAICLNRYQAPFSYYTLAVMDYLKGDCRAVFANADKYLSAAKEVRSETILIKMLLLFAIAAIQTGEKEKGLSWARLADEYLVGTDILAPVVEVLLISPQNSEYLSRVVPERSAKIFQRCAQMASQCRRGIETFQTYRISQLRRSTRESRITKSQIEEFTSKMNDRRKSLGLSRGEYSCAVLAASRFSNAEIERILECSEDSVKSCLKRAFAKLGIRSRSQLKAIVPSIEK